MVSEYAQSWDDAVERRVVRKIDLILMPFMWFGYGLVYYDKVITETQRVRYAAHLETQNEFCLRV